MVSPVGEIHSLVYGRRASGENGRKLTACTWAGSSLPGGLSGFNTTVNIAIAIGAQAEKKWYKHNPDVS